VDRIELMITEHICDLGEGWFNVACDDPRRGYWYITDLDGENFVDSIIYCPLCGKNLHDLNKIKCKICKGNIDLTGIDCVPCQGTGWQQVPEPEDGIDAPIINGLMEKIEEKKKEELNKESNTT